MVNTWNVDTNWKRPVCIPEFEIWKLEFRIQLCHTYKKIPFRLLYFQSCAPWGQRGDVITGIRRSPRLAETAEYKRQLQILVFEWYIECGYQLQKFNTKCTCTPIFECIRCWRALFWMHIDPYVSAFYDFFQTIVDFFFRANRVLW